MIFLLGFFTFTAAEIFVHDFEIENNMYTDNPVPVNHHKVQREAINPEEKQHPYRRVIKIIYSTPAKEIEDIVRHVILGGKLDQFFQPTADDNIVPRFRIRKGKGSYEPRSVLTTQSPPEYIAWFDAESKLLDNTETPVAKRTPSPINKEISTLSTEEHDETIGSLAFLNDKSNELTIDYWNYLFAIMKTGKDYSKRQINSNEMINFTSVPVQAPVYYDDPKELQIFIEQPLAIPLTPQPIAEPMSKEVNGVNVRKNTKRPYVHFYEKRLNNTIKDTLKYVQTNPYVTTVSLEFVPFKYSRRWPPVYKQYPIELTIAPVAAPEIVENKAPENEPELVKIIPVKPEKNEMPKFIIPVEQYLDATKQNAETQKHKTKIYTWLPYTEKKKYVSKFSIRKTIGSSETANIFGEATPLKPPVFFNETIKPPPLLIANKIEAFIDQHFETEIRRTHNQIPTQAHIKLPKILLYKTARPLVEPPVDSAINYNEGDKPGLQAYFKARKKALLVTLEAGPPTTQDYDAGPEIERRTKVEYYDTTLETVKESDARRKNFYDDPVYKETQEGKPLKYNKLLEDLGMMKMDRLDNILQEILKVSVQTDSSIAKTLLHQEKNKTITVMPSPSTFDIPALIDVIDNLTVNWQGDILEILNKSLANQTFSTCKEPHKELAENDIDYINDYGNDVDRSNKKDPYAKVDGLVMGKCFVCGMVETEMPMNSLCSDAFTSGLVPFKTVDAAFKNKIGTYKKFCRWRNMPGYEISKQDPRSMFGRWTGGCSVRWIDISGMYTQRTCRNMFRPALGRHWASKRMTKLELALRHVENGCIVSPIASLVPFSRAISLYARFHACVCSSNWCNHGSLLHKWSTFIIMLGFTTTVIFKSFLMSL